MAHDVIEAQASKLAIASWSTARSVHEDPYIGRKTLGLIMEGEGAHILFSQWHISIDQLCHIRMSASRPYLEADMTELARGRGGAMWI